MKTIFIFIITLYTLSICETPLITVSGTGARSQGLGNNFTALSNDYSATFWNPAGLAFSPVREIHVGMGLSSAMSTTELGTVSTDFSKSSLNFSSAGLVRSLPTKQGGISFAFGYSSPYSFEDLQRYKGDDIYIGSGYIWTATDTLYPGDMLHYDDSKMYINGRLGLFTAACGWQIAERLGIGVSASFIYGNSSSNKSILSYTANGSMLDDGSDIRSQTRYTGIDIRIGGMYKITDKLSSGVRFEIPQTIRYYNKITGPFPSESHRGLLKSSVSGAVGLAYTFPFSTISADVQFRSPNPEIDDGDLSHWKGGAGGGIEIPIPKTNTLLRAGYSWKQSDLFPFTEFDSKNKLVKNSQTITEGTDDVHMISAGATILISDAIQLEFAYSNTRFALRSEDADWYNALNKKSSLHRGNVTVTVQY
ncbi:MAG TPA: hypothetical protein VHO70_03330 [Chitinispirillaceae bacterium]|nr:hypothetical protein [Chitinispirillaceae bacterium]